MLTRRSLGRDASSADLIEFARTRKPHARVFEYVRTYQGYSSDILSTINYLYIGYDAFMAGVASSCPPLFEVDSQGAVTKFPLKHAAIVGAFKKKGNAPSDKACRGGCGFFRATDSSYCSRCRQSPMATEVVERLPGNAEC